MTVNLDPYNQKRNFNKTTEPKGEVALSGKALRFAVQHHLARRDHYDFRLAWEGTLLSWAVPKGPSFDPGDKRLAVRVENHPLSYKDFEGTIPQGEYGGGTVMLWDEGFWEPIGDAAEGLCKGTLKFILKGSRLKGKWALVRLKAKTGDKQENWLFIKEKDDYAKTSPGISEFATSVRTQRTMAEIAAGAGAAGAKNPFSTTDVQPAKLVTTVPPGDDWLYELKYDGYRIIAYIEGNRARLFTRNGNDYSNRFQSIAASLLHWADGRAMVLDGEMAVLDPSGKTDFQALQNHLRDLKNQKLTYIIFDLLALDGTDLRSHPLCDRKERLSILMQDAPHNLWYSRHVQGRGKESLAAAYETGAEGIVGKKADSVYSGTRNGDWIKVKCEKRQEFVIGGYTVSEKRASGISALLLGVYEGDAFVYVGRVGTGFSTAVRNELEKEFTNIRRDTPPFKQKPQCRPTETVVWLKPQRVAEIKFAAWTDEHLLRQASFKGLRTDKNPKEIIREKADEENQPQIIAENKDKPMETMTKNRIVEGIRITHPDKILFHTPEITKGDVVQYYQCVAPRMLPYVSHRILSIVRCPQGIEKTCFFKKHPNQSSKGIITIAVSTDDGVEDYFYIEDAAGLISEAQMGTLEFHTWGSRVETLEQPDVMVFDLDPYEGTDLATVRQGVKDLLIILSELGLKSYLKTSGGKGYHVVVPFEPAASWDIFHDFAKRIAEVMEQKWPDRYTANSRKVKRKDKIFIDWLRNGRGATSIAPYALRARSGAKVSLPIGWDELDTIAPDGIDMREALKRLAQDDPWKNFYETHQLLK